MKKKIFVNHFEKSNKMEQEKSNTNSQKESNVSKDSESRQLDGTVSGVRDTESSVKNTESSVRSSTGHVSNRDTTPNRDIKGPFEGFHSKF